MSGRDSPYWINTSWKKLPIACRGFKIPNPVFDGFKESLTSIIVVEFTVFLTMYAATRRILTPICMSYVSQIAAAVIIAPIFSYYFEEISFDGTAMINVAAIFTYSGFFLHVFMLGVETNITKLRRATNKKSITIGVVGMITSLAFSYITYLCVKDHVPEKTLNMVTTVTFNASNFLMSTTSHLNDLGFSGSKLGNTTAAAAMILDIPVFIAGVISVSIIWPLVKGGRAVKEIGFVTFYYVAMFVIFRPVIMYLIKRNNDGKRMRQVHFVLIVLCGLVLAMMADAFEQKFSPFYLAFTLPEEPLSTVLQQRLDPFASFLFFPFYILAIGMRIMFDKLKVPSSFYIEAILLMGYIGKFLGSMTSARFLGYPYSESITMGLILSARGLLDLSSTLAFRRKGWITEETYTIYVLHSLLTMAVFLPIARYTYDASKQYSTILRNSLLDLQENDGTIKILTCIYNEDNLPGILRLLKLCQTNPQNPTSVIALQLLQLPGRAAIPIMAPLHEVSAISSFRSHIANCNRIVNSFISLERASEGSIRTQHYVAMSQFTSMHNDICNLAYEMSACLVILPFHISWGSDDIIKESSNSIRDVNQLVLQKAPCSVGFLVDRSGSHQPGLDYDMYMIAMIFIGGIDDYEGLAYSRLFANHPRVVLNVIWIKGPSSKDNNEDDHHVWSHFRKTCMENRRISFKEVIVKNGAETVQVIISIKDEVDLVVVGKHHSPDLFPLTGLSDRWTEYPELGVLGDICASTDFNFSLLVVQQEPQNMLTSEEQILI